MHMAIIEAGGDKASLQIHHLTVVILISQGHFVFAHVDHIAIVNDHRSRHTLRHRINDAVYINRSHEHSPFYENKKGNESLSLLMI